MNPSRDIEKLFDQFGGDAGNYQEIGRENEASHARTRWPLLATLDLSQPSIPNIAPIRDSLLSPVQGRSAETRKKAWGAPAETAPADDLAASGTLANAPANPPFTRDTRPRLFSRPNRKTIPPVANIALPGSTVGAERFSALVDAVEGASNVEDTPAVAAPEQIARVQTPAHSAAHSVAHSAAQAPQQQTQPQRPTLPRTQPLATPGQLPGFASAFQVQRPLPAAKPSLPRIQPAQTASDTGSQSILGQLFRAQGGSQSGTSQKGSVPRTDSLQSMFQRLREPAAAASPASEDDVPAAGSWLAKRASRS
ncbi:hypothetical protein ASG35_20460 [Burkholderia sp. Leaf177]|uniref:cellulose biosynthesis protein BcsP n=1 Tax=Burkholderia sp. Leaf177 TaxID=1736287 RepID=UPI0006F39C2D|nr:cellulose biosynthesis protein BcsP [Burkholderia sp. Leaf177]KQR74163.1 hypothetical protein ASG35_20460 [Burkholderia sp. Leaf177]